MSSPITLFRLIARAVIDAVEGGIPDGESLIELIPGIGQDVWDAWADGSVSRPTAVRDQDRGLDPGQ